MLTRYIKEKDDQVWKIFLKEAIKVGGGCGESGLFMELKKGMLIGVSEYYKEVLGAWGVFVKRVKYDCKSVQHVWDQPMFLNPQILHEGKTMYNKTMWRSGFRRVRELAYEYVPGFMSAQAVVDEVREMGEEISFCAAEGMVKKIKAGMPRE